jgi:hypothetical protein
MRRCTLLLVASFALFGCGVGTEVTVITKSRVTVSPRVADPSPTPAQSRDPWVWPTEADASRQVRCPVTPAFLLFESFHNNASAADKTHRERKWLRVGGKVAAVEVERGVPCLTVNNTLDKARFRTIRCYFQSDHQLRGVHKGMNVRVFGLYAGCGGGVIVLAAASVEDANTYHWDGVPIRLPTHIPGRD